MTGLRVEAFGECRLGPVQVVTLGEAPGPVLRVLDLGATVHALEVADADGVRRNVALGHATPEEYLASTAYLGAVVGRYANRIAGGRFSVDGVPVQVGVNDRGNSLHGGPDGFDRRVWQVAGGDAGRVVMRLVSPDGDQGFPGEVVAEATYAVEGDAVRLDLVARTDAATPVGLTSHAYLNLDGDGGSAMGHRLQVVAERYLPVDATGIPLGHLADVAGTPFDLRAPTVVGDAVRGDHPQVRDARGIDHAFAVQGEGWRRVASLEAARSGIGMDLFSDQPALQVYTGNFLDGSAPGTSGRLYRQGDGIALEPEVFPDSPHRPELTPCLLRPGETYRAALEWQFRRTR